MKLLFMRFANGCFNQKYYIFCNLLIFRGRDLKTCEYKFVLDHLWDWVLAVPIFARCHRKSYVNMNSSSTKFKQKLEFLWCPTSQLNFRPFLEWSHLSVRLPNPVQGR